MKSLRAFAISAAIVFLLIPLSCTRGGETVQSDGSEAAFFEIMTDADGVRNVIVTSPYGGSPDTLRIERPLSSIVCMSSTSVAGFCAIGAAEVVTGVSGMNYISSPEILQRRDAVIDVGYEPELDLEAVLRLDPDVVLAYSASSETPAYVRKLRDLGVPVLMLYDFLENHPLARAEYLLLYGALCGRESEAEELFREVRADYLKTAQRLQDVEERPGVLVNTPYSDIWYIPGLDNYFSRLVRDAGGVTVGSEPGTESSSVSLEEAFRLSSEAQIWLNPGWCTSREEIAAIHPLVSEFPVLKNGRVFNNIKRANSGGGNDFWESGSVRPDLILHDLAAVIHPEIFPLDEGLEYYIEVD